MKNRIIICALIFVANLLTGGTDQPFGLLPTPPEFTYDYDWENDATYDLTDAGDSVCHTYTPGDSLLAKVKATTATYTAENSVEVIVPEEEEYTFDTVLTEEIWEGKDFTPTDWIFDDEGTPWILGNSSWLGDSTDQYQWVLISDTLGIIDTLYSTGEFTLILDNNILGSFMHYEFGDTIYEITDSIIDTVIFKNRVFDSLVVTPILGNSPSWKLANRFVEPLVIADNGWAFVKIYDFGGSDILYPDWDYAITNYGEPTYKIDIPGSGIERVGGRDFRACRLAGKYFAVASPDTNTIYNTNWNISVFDTVGNLHFTRELVSYASNRIGLTFGLLPDGSILYVDESSGESIIKRSTPTEEYTYPVSDTVYCGVSLGYGYNRLLLVVYPSNDDKNFLYCFDLSDSLELVWADSLNQYIGMPEILPEGDILLSYTENDYSGFSYQVVSDEDGIILASWQDNMTSYPVSQIHNGRIFLKYFESDPYRTHFRLIRVIKGGE